MVALLIHMYKLINLIIKSRTLQNKQKRQLNLNYKNRTVNKILITELPFITTRTKLRFFLTCAMNRYNFYILFNLMEKSGVVSCI